MFYTRKPKCFTAYPPIRRGRSEDSPLINLGADSRIFARPGEPRRMIEPVRGYS